LPLVKVMLGKCLFLTILAYNLTYMILILDIDK